MKFVRPLSDRCNHLAKNNNAKRKRDYKVLHSSEIPLNIREHNECSVASCSVNYLECCTNDDEQSVGIRSCFPDDAMSACPPMSAQENNDVYGSDLHMNVHELELQAYQSTIRAFHAAGPLTWEQESLLTNLRLSLNISNEEHLLQILTSGFIPLYEKEIAARDSALKPKNQKLESFSLPSYERHVCICSCCQAKGVVHVTVTLHES
ncbi:unnamed protein product [Urochloa humidicola]